MKYVKKLLIILLILLSFSTNPVYAIGTSIKSIKIKDRSSTIKLENPTINNNRINAKILFKNIGDYVTYELTLKMNTSEYTIKDVTDNNSNKNIKSTYTYSGNKVYMTLKYENELTQALELDEIELNVVIEDVDGNEDTLIINPKTSDDIVKYVSVLGTSTLFLSGIILLKKKKKKYALLALLLVFPTTYVAAKSSIKIGIQFDSEEINVGYDVAFIKGDGVTGEVETIECIFGEECELPQNTFEKENKIFTGWASEVDGQVIYVDEDKVNSLIAGGTFNLYPVWEDDTRVVMFDTGKVVNTKIKLIYAEQEYAGQSLENTTEYIPNLKRATTLPDTTNFTETNIISAPNSKKKIYAWAVDTQYDTDIYWYVDSDTVYLNEDSSYLFANLPFIYVDYLGDFNLSLVRNVSYMFKKCYLEYSTIWDQLSTWDTSNITNMEGMFESVYDVDFTKISGWNVSNVTNMSRMFLNAFDIDTPSASRNASYIKDWDVRKVTNFHNMFGLLQGSYMLSPSDVTYPIFTKLEGMWDNSNEILLDGMYYSGTYVTLNPYTLKFNGNGSTSGTMTEKTCNYDIDCFISINKFKKDDYIFSGWSFTPDGEVLYEDGDFINIDAEDSHEKTLYAIWEPYRKTTATVVTGMNFNKRVKLLNLGEKGDYTSDYYTIGNSTYNIVDDMGADISTFVRRDSIPDTIEISSLNIVSIPDSDRKMFIWLEGDYNQNLYFYTDAEVIYLNENSSKMFKKIGYIFSNDLDVFDTSHVKNMSEMFVDGTDYEFRFSSLTNWDVSNVTNMSYMFKGLLGVDNYWGDISQYLGEWDVRKVTKFIGMFSRNYNGEYKLPIFKLKPGQWTGNIQSENYVPFEEGTYYVISYDGNGNTDESYAQKYTICRVGQDCTIASNLYYKTNHTLSGWATAPDGEVVYQKGQTVNNITTESNITLYAKWQKSAYTITLQGNGGATSTNLTSTTVNCNISSQCTISYSNFKRDGYSFIGWSTTPNGEVEYQNGYKIPANTEPEFDTLYAVWENNGSIVYPNGKSKLTVQVGDTVSIGNEEFYVLKRNNSDLYLLAKYNLNVGDNLNTSVQEGIQNKNNYSPYGFVHFAETNYWNGDVGEEKTYSGSYSDLDSTPYVYDSHSILYNYVESYANYLEDEYDVDIKSAKVLSYQDLIELGCFYSPGGDYEPPYILCNYLPNNKKFVYSANSWLGSAPSDTTVWYILTDGEVGDEAHGSTVSGNHGVRPLIII